MTKTLGLLVSLALLTLAPRADAGLQAALSLDGGASLLACDQNVCAGGDAPTFSDADPTVGVLSTLPAMIGPISASFAIQTSVKSAAPGGLNTLSTAGTVVQNTDTVGHAIQLTIGDINFLGPANTFTATGSGTWVDQTLPAEFGGTTITMEWWNDPANAQGAEFAGDTPGLLVNSASHAPADGTANQSFGGPSSPFNVSGSVLDPANFSMTLDNALVLGPGIRLESLGQALSKEQLAVVRNPASALLVGPGMLSILAVGRRRRLP
jgi:hypothetical protein